VDALYTTYIFPYPKVYALDANNLSNTLWSKTQLQLNCQPSAPIYYPALWQTTTVANHRLYIGTIDNRVAALNTDGCLLWISQPYARVVAGVAVSDGKVAFGTDDSRVIALNESDGTFLWSRPVNDAVIMVPLIAQGNVYVTSRAGRTYAFKANSTGVTGDPVWQSADMGPGLYSTPAYHGAHLYFGSQNYGFIALNATTGVTDWVQPTIFPSQSSVAYANGYVYGTTASGTLVALDASNGNIVDTRPFDVSGGTSSPAVFNGWVWAEDSTGSVYGFKPDPLLGGILINWDGDIDSDGDDCAPRDPAINHGAQESAPCDGVDNDCDGLVDEGLTGCSTFCP
jgi:outer membrane protein assembly factor BamB